MRFKWQKDLFAEPAAPNDRPLRDHSRFDMGGCPGCPGCRGLRTVASPRCDNCGSTRPVTADA